ncbi:DUF6519 domain-containing protein [Xylophilus sp. GOD-11R]|uniref:DUF6519 domain-containing protein n=1 Tax=Xylophilus sp. GOD-11R TaxID=3089814 RepID=UPI00298D43AA|nr:DUF6519 domain-containing protein [Xylophilus sp. GOD-11R]WPB55018.1 DUF6519 domain-containing protein [Xylophilus sp. GOD-11R]
MKGDFSRESFRPAAHYSAVRLQQGRVVTDADWNEQADLSRYRSERFARDAIGPAGMPVDAAGYALRAETRALAVLALNPNVAWVLAEDGLLLHTANAGADWLPADLLGVAHPYAAAQAGGVGWVVGEGGLLRKTGDQGQTWTAREAGTLRDLRGVAAFGADRAWAVGDGGTVVATEDGGATWRQAVTDAERPDALFAVRFIDAFEGVAVGRRGAIYGSTDGGHTWLRQDSGTTAHLQALAGIGTNLLWAAGQGGTVLRSTDAGQSWLPCATPSDATLHAIVFRDPLEGWAAGDRGTVLYTLDGGAHWSRIDVGVDTPLRGLSASDGDAVWAVGDAGVALRLDSGTPAAQTVALPAAGLSIGPGRCWLDGLLCELDDWTGYAHQPDGGAGERLAPGAWLVYLDAWQRHVSALEAPEILEVALGGPDTATRARTVAQVRALPLVVGSPFDWDCADEVAAWTALVNAPGPKLAARAEPQLAAANLCEIAATAGYRRLENQLYRVEVHQAGGPGGAQASFKWSRENGSVAYGVLAVEVDTAANRTVVRLAARGRDANLDLAPHDRVELCDDDSELGQRHGVLLEYLADGDDELELVLQGVPGGTTGRDPSRHPLLRRWDHRPAAGALALPVVEGGWIELEEGVQVRFEPGGHYRSGDYWLIPARTVTADVEWPKDADGDPLACPPAGIADAYCRLGIVEVDSTGAVTVVADCREVFAPLASLRQLFYVSGDGQDAAPGAVLPQPLALRVARASVPLPGARILFEVESGGGGIGGEVDDTALSAMYFDTRTDEHGMAECRWALGPGAAAPARFQRVRASLCDSYGLPLPGQTLVFCATASLGLYHLAGDGQEAPAGQPLPHRLEVRVSHADVGHAGAAVRFAVEEGGGALTGANPAITGADGIAGVAWQLGTDALQRVSAELLDHDGQPLQRIAFNAGVVQPATVGGGGRAVAACEITVGPNGDVPDLKSEVLRGLLTGAKGQLCLCFMPGHHVIDELEVEGGSQARLSLHGCGQASRVSLGKPITLRRFAALDFADLVIELHGERGLMLAEIGELSLSHVSLQAVGAPAQPCLRAEGVRRLRVQDCVFAAGVSDKPGVAAIFDQLAGDNQIARNRFEGMVSFYGDPLDPAQWRDLIPVVRERLVGRPLVVDASRLFFSDNSVALLGIGETMVKRLAEGVEEGIFESATLQGNSFSGHDHLLAAGLIAFAGNSFTEEPRSEFYGTMVANRATAVGNLAQRMERAKLWFITRKGEFEAAANLVTIDN